jgi:hypothetical protein
VDAGPTLSGKNGRGEVASMTKALSSCAALLGAGFLVALAARSQEPASTPATEPTAIPSPGPLVALPCVSSPARGFFSPPQMPLPPELQGDVVLVKTGSVRVFGKPRSMKPYEVRELKISPLSRVSKGGEVPLNLSAVVSTFLSPFWAEALNMPAPKGIQVESVEARQEFTFQLVKEGVGAALPVEVRCAWVAGATTASLPLKSVSVEKKVPAPNMMACELSDAPGSEPWRLMLWVGRPTGNFSMEFPSGGELVRGSVRYEATSTNATNPSLGVKGWHITGTLFTKEGRVAAAVERMGGVRVLTLCSLPPAEQALFVAVGAAVSLRDDEASKYE